MVLPTDWGVGPWLGLELYLLGRGVLPREEIRVEVGGYSAMTWLLEKRFELTHLNISARSYAQPRTM